MQRDYTNALELYRNALRFKSNRAQAHYFIGRVYQAWGQYLEATDEFENAENARGADPAQTKRSFDRLRDAFLKGHKTGYWLEQANQTQSKPVSEYYWKAVVQVQLGDTNGAFFWLNKSLLTHEMADWGRETDGLLFDEYWDSLRDDPSFIEFAKRAGFRGTRARLD